jgi:DNA polymerase III alpha subunit
MKTNDCNQYIINEEDAIQSLLSGVELNEFVTEDPSWVDKFNFNSKLFDLNYSINAELPATDNKKYLEECIQEWYIPEQYKSMNIEEFLLNKCNTQKEIDRVNYEFDLYKERNLTLLLKFLCFFVDKIRENGIILGVGRGSSVSSYILYLIGIHKVNSIEYDLDIKEFLK